MHLLTLTAFLLFAPPECDPSADVSRPVCASANWICMSPRFAAAQRAEREALSARCEAEKNAIREEASTVLRRETGKLFADLETERGKLEISLDALAGAERAAQAAQAEASSKWTTLELVGFIAGGIAVGAAAGALIAVYGR